MVDLHFDTDAVQIRIRDDGGGFDPQAENLDGHFGLRGMRERAQQVGGHFTIHSETAAGTEIVVNVPLNDHDGR
jgi:signal transduction histidine kinase